MIYDRQSIQNRYLSHAIGMVHRATEGRQCAAIMADNGEAPVTEAVHQSDAVARFGSL
jgi:hypothetical protein